MKYCAVVLSLFALFAVNGGINYYYNFFCCHIETHSSATTNEATCTSSCCTENEGFETTDNNKEPAECPVKDYHSFISESLTSFDYTSFQNVNISAPILTILVWDNTIITEEKSISEEYIHLNKPPPKSLTGKELLQSIQQIKIPDHIV